MNYINNNEVLKNAIDFIMAGVNGKRFDEITSSLMNIDPYMALADFADYQKAQQQIQRLYADKEKFTRMSLMNISGAGVFSADRSIMDYANRIWHTAPVPKDAVPTPRQSKKPAQKTPRKRTSKKTK